MSLVKSVAYQLKAAMESARLKQKKQREQQKKLMQQEQEELQQLEEEQKKAERVASLPVIGADSVKVNSDAANVLKAFSPFLEHLTADGQSVPVALTKSEGHIVVMPLGNLVLNTHDFQIAQHKQGRDYTRENLTMLPDVWETEIFTNQEDYRREQLCRRDALKKKNS